MLVDDIGDVTITNDGATILKQLEAWKVWKSSVLKLSGFCTVLTLKTPRRNIHQPRFWWSWRTCRSILEKMTTLSVTLSIHIMTYHDIIQPSKQKKMKKSMQ